MDGTAADKTRPRHYTVSWNTSIADIPEAAWDALAKPAETALLEWEWLRLFEASGCMTAETGWLPCHMTVWSGDDLVAAAPLYVKGHSEGEFVWDYAWADVASQLDVRYYPKLLGMSPATPAVGYRFLVAPGHDEAELTPLMLEAAHRFCRRNSIRNVAFNFVDPSWRPFVERFGFSAWRHQSYEWRNPGYTSFDDYLQAFTKNQRRNIRREREAMSSQGLSMKAYTGEEIPESFFPLMFRYYEKTNDQFGPWAAKYLNEEFFLGLSPKLRDRLLFIAAFAEGRRRPPVALSLLIVKGSHMIGRYWGAEEYFDALHFNACYYSPIEWAIGHGVRTFDPGAGSPHKLRRGFLAVENHSLHYFYDDQMRAIMERHIGEINDAERHRIEAMNAAVPMKEGEPPAARGFAAG